MLCGEGIGEGQELKLGNQLGVYSFIQEAILDPGNTVEHKIPVSWNFNSSQVKQLTNKQIILASAKCYA